MKRVDGRAGLGSPPPVFFLPLSPVGPDSASLQAVRIRVNLKPPRGERENEQLKWYGAGGILYSGERMAGRPGGKIRS